MFNEFEYGTGRVESRRTNLKVVRGGGGAGEEARQYHVQRHVTRAQLLAVAHLDVLDLRRCTSAQMHTLQREGTPRPRVVGASPSLVYASALPQVSTRTSCSSIDLIGTEHSSTRICTPREFRSSICTEASAYITTEWKNTIEPALNELRR